MRRMLSASCVVALVLAAGPARGADDNEAKMRAVIAKAIKAQGGAENINKVKAIRMKLTAKFHSMGTTINFSGSAAFELPDKLRLEGKVEAGNRTTGKSVQVLNGDKGWVAINDEKPRAMNKEELAEAREHLYDVEVTRLTPLDDKAFKLSPLGEQKVGDREAVGVRVSHKGRRDISLYFDKETGLLLKSETRVKDAKGREVTQETLYQGYKKVDGLQIAHKSVVNRDGKLFMESEASDVRVAEKLDPSTFAKP